VQTGKGLPFSLAPVSIRFQKANNSSALASDFVVAFEGVQAKASYGKKNAAGDASLW
jgi:hypothetical protein